MRLARTFGSALALVCLAGPAPAWVASNNLIVKLGQNAQLIVPYRSQSGEEDVWCAVSDYVMRKASLPGNTMIYRVTPPPIHVGQTVVFSLNAMGAAMDTGLDGANQMGGIPAGVGQGLCIDSAARRHN